MSATNSVERRRRLPHIVLPTERPRGIMGHLTGDRNDSLVGELAEATVQRFNAMQQEIDALNARQVGMIASAGDGRPVNVGRSDPRRSNLYIGAYRKGFDAYFRHGAESSPDGSLRELEVRADMTIGSNPDGGYTVLPEIEQVVTSVMAPASPMRQLAQVVAVSTAEYEKLINTTRSNSGWVGEKDSRPPTTSPQLSKLRFPVMEMYSDIYCSQSLLDDSFVDIGTWLAGEVAGSMAIDEGYAFIQGNGVMKPYGIAAGYPLDTADDFDSTGVRDRAWGKIQSINVGASPSDSDIVTGLVNATMALGTRYRGNACWVMSRAFCSVVRQLKDSTGRLLFSNDGRIASGTPDTLLGWPVYLDDSFTTPAANAVVCAFGDMKQAYLVVDRIGMRVLRDPFTNKPLVGFYVTKRVGGGVQNFDAVKLIKYA